MIELELFELSKIDLLRSLHFLLCLSGFFILNPILFKQKKPNGENVDRDWGITLISFAFLIWSAMDLYRILGFMQAGQVSVILKIFSAYNNAMFLAALPFFTRAFVRVRKWWPAFAHGNQWAIRIFLLNVLVVLLYSITWSDSQQFASFVKNFDAVYSALTFFLLGYAITVSFRRNDRYGSIYSYAGFAVTGLLVIPQFAFLSIFRITHFDLISLLLMTSQFMLLCLIIIQSYSTVLDHSIQLLMSSNEMHLISISALEEQNNSMSNQLAELESETVHLRKQVSELGSEMEETTKKLRLETESNKLTTRELEILSLIDKSYLEIGEALFISRDTVISHKRNIETKLGTNGKSELEAYARRMGILANPTR